MRLLVDQNLPYRLVTFLNAAGHDVVHTEDIGMARTSAADCPSVLITREIRTAPTAEVAAILVANLPQIQRIIADHGSAVFSLAPDKPIRAELLPLGLPAKGD